MSKSKIVQNQDPLHGIQVKMHEGEIDTDIALVNRLLAEQFPHLADNTITVVHPTGTVNAIFRVGNGLCARLPRMDKWAASIDREWIWLPKLAPHILLTIPKPLARGKPSTLYPYPWGVYHWIEGQPYRDDLVSDEREVASGLANFVMELRRVNKSGAPRGGRPPLIELDAATRKAIVSSRGQLDGKSALAAWKLSLSSPPWDGTPVWVHGDLLRTNLLIRDGRLCAVLDFGGVGIGDPEVNSVQH